MQIFDLLLILSILMLSLSLWGGMATLRKYQCFFLALVIFSAALHLFIEGARWQVVPVYLVGAVFLGLALRFFYKRGKGSVEGAAEAGVLFVRSRRLVSGGAIFFLFISFVCSYLFPVFTLPEPTGKYDVGTEVFHLTDRSRQNTFTEKEGDFRELMVKAWYPSDSGEEGRADTYWENAEIQSQYLISDEGGAFYHFVFNHLDRVKTHSFRGAPLSAAEPLYPVLIFSHGLGSYSSQNTVLMEEMASHGYIVFSINHTYWSMVSVFPDGRVIGRRKDSREVEEESENPDAEALYLALVASNDNAEKLRLIDEVINVAPLTAASERKGLDAWSDDQRFLMSTLEQWQHDKKSGVPFSGKMDLSRLGVIGMSYGGKTTIETCAIDVRCKAGVNLDGFSVVSPQAPAQKVPFMHMNSEKYKLTDVIYDKAQGPSYLVSVAGSEHMDYTDLSLLSPLTGVFGVVGSIDGNRMLMIMNVYVRAFFDTHLKANHETQLLSLSDRFSEVTFVSKNIGSNNE